MSSFCSAKATHIFSAKNIRILYIESAKTVNEMTLNELVKLTTLWTTGPRILLYICRRIGKSCAGFIYLFIYFSFRKDPFFLIFYTSIFLQTIRDCNCAEGQCEAGEKYAEELEDVIRFSMPKGKVGAFFAESIQVYSLHYQRPAPMAQSDRWSEARRFNPRLFWQKNVHNTG